MSLGLDSSAVRIKISYLKVWIQVFMISGSLHSDDPLIFRASDGSTFKLLLNKHDSKLMNILDLTDKSFHLSCELSQYLLDGLA